MFNQMALGRTDLATVLDIIKGWMKTALLPRAYIIITLHLIQHIVGLNCVEELGSVTNTPFMKLD